MIQKVSAKLVETKLPLWWLIATGGMVVYTMGSTVANFNTVEQNLEKIDSKMEVIDTRVQTIVNQMTAFEGQNQLQDSRINYLQNEVRGRYQNNQQGENN